MARLSANSVPAPVTHHRGRGQASRPFRYLSLFSGVEAASVAWQPLGWQPAAFAEIDAFPCAVLAHHYPDVPNLGSVTDITDEQIAELGPIDLIVGGFPCFTAGHLVLCKRGLVPIEDVAVGDEVWTHARRWRPVTATMTRRAPTVRMRGQGHAAMRTTPDHRFYATRTERTWNGRGYTRSVTEPEWVAASDMAGRRWATPIEVDGLSVPLDLGSLDIAYLAGLYLGDGHIVKHAEKAKKSVILSVGNHKRDWLVNRLRSAWGAVTVTPHGESVTRLQLSRTYVACALLREFGEYCHRKTIPSWALCAPREWREALLAGVLDTDGSPIANGHRVTTVSRALAIGLRLLAASLGFSTALDFTERPRQTVIEGRTVNQRDTWTVFMRKAARASELRADGHAWGLVRSVSDAGVDTVYDITVDEDHSFVCDGLVVHNCQDLSVAGKRAGLRNDDGTVTRSGLFFDAMRIVRWAREHCGLRWLLIENVPGLYSSNRGRDFAAVVGEMVGTDFDVPDGGWRNAGFAVGPEGLCEWATLDAQFFNLAQRRVRVFALADFGDWSNRPPVLLEPESMRGDPPTRGEARQGSPAGALRSTDGGSDVDHARARHLIPAPHTDLSPVLKARDSKGPSSDGDGDGAVLVPMVAPTLQAGGNDTGGHRPPGADADTADSLVVTHSLRAEGFDASEDGAGRGTPIVPVAPRTFACAGCGETISESWGWGQWCDYCGHEHGEPIVPVHAFDARQSDVVQYGDKTGALDTRWDSIAVAFDTTQITSKANRSNPQPGDPCHTLAKGSHAPAVAIRTAQTGSNGWGVDPDTAYTLDQAQGQAVQAGMAVRRLTPRECERLQGFPDDWTLIPWRTWQEAQRKGASYESLLAERGMRLREPAGEACPDGPRYKALGNSMAVPVILWIGQRIDAAVAFARRAVA